MSFESCYSGFSPLSISPSTLINVKCLKNAESQQHKRAIVPRQKLQDSAAGNIDSENLFPWKVVPILRKPFSWVDKISGTQFTDGTIFLGTSLEGPDFPEAKEFPLYLEENLESRTNGVLKLMQMENKSKINRKDEEEIHGIEKDAFVWSQDWFRRFAFWFEL